ncbi:histidine kinase [Paraflavitalea sp. CAU 1676]|uniref:sensor histidine kinase n=1 Tax=Paraflavitalea sp. CAU 1676 TaxID=3032598 RepID=UPI0023DC9243|nr:histidine kinase [Paraflavitalea sp. CAU 1676]MDF2192134.1 histidine kinase [Paraflavitalea sp. CAU 1676]
MFTHRYRYLFIALLALYAFINTELCEVYYYFNIRVAWYHALLTILLITWMSWESNRLLEIPVQRWHPPGKRRGWYLATFFLTGMAASCAGAIAVVYTIGLWIYGYTWTVLEMPIKLNLIYAGLITLFFHLLNTILYFFGEYKNKLTEAEELKRINAQAQLQAIKSQVNPHFLFNNLNVLSGMVIKDNPRANRFIEEFSKVYRYILNTQDIELVELEKELAFIKPYVYLLQQRYPEGLQVHIGIPAQYNARYIIPVALQMLIENAIKHNVISRTSPLHIEVLTVGAEALVVRNNRQPRRSVEQSNRIGLNNIAQRYEMICGRQISIHKTRDVFEVTLPLLQLN